MPLRLPDDEPASLDDRATLRWAVRAARGRAFLFVNNHQPHESLPNHHGVQFDVHLETGEHVTLPARPVTVPAGAHFVWPIGLELGSGLRLRWATAQPVTTLEASGGTLTVMVAVDGIPVTLSLPTEVDVQGAAQVRRDAAGTLITVDEPGTGALLTLTGTSGTAQVLILAQHQALQLNRIHAFGEDRLVLSEDLVLTDGDEIRLHIASAAPSIALFPAPTGLHGGGAGEPAADGIFTRWPLSPASQLSRPELELLKEASGAAPARSGGPHQRASAPRDEDFEKAAIYRVTVSPEALDGDGEVLLRLRYTGDTARAYIDGQLVADHFWFGRDWEIGLRRFAAAVTRQGLEIRVLPLDPASQIYVDASVRTGLDAACSRATIESADLVAVPRVSIHAG